jgi:formate dehydrogenase accessory protein FdhD
MVQKAASAGFRLLAALSAPTELAVKLAEMSGLTLLGFVRSGQHTLYSHPERLD